MASQSLSPAAPKRMHQVALAFAVAIFAAPSAAQDVGRPLQAYYEMVHGYSTGRLDVALAQFSDTAVVIAGPLCTTAQPCVGRAAILQRYLLTGKSRGLAPPLADQRFDGTRLTTWGEPVGGYRLDDTAPRLWGGHVFEFRDGRIESLWVELDAADLQTAAFIARREAQGEVVRYAAGTR